MAENAKMQTKFHGTETIDGINYAKLEVLFPLTLDGQKDGAKYFVPRKSRDGEGKLLKTENGDQLYDMKDGSTTTEPFDADGETIRRGVEVEQKQATPHITKRVNITPKLSASGEVNVPVFEDGMVRQFAVQVKANNATKPEDITAKASAASAERKEKMLKSMSEEEILAFLAKRKSEVAAK